MSASNNRSARRDGASGHCANVRRGNYGDRCRGNTECLLTARTSTTRALDGYLSYARYVCGISASVLTPEGWSGARRQEGVGNTDGGGRGKHGIEMQALLR